MISFQDSPVLYRSNVPSRYHLRQPIPRAGCSTFMTAACVWAFLTATVAGSEFYFQPTPAPFDLAFGRKVSADGTAAIGQINSITTTDEFVVPPAYIWTARDGFETVPAPPELNSISHRFLDVSDDGQVFLGRGSIEDGDDTFRRVFLYSLEHGHTFLPAAADSSSEVGLTISGDGETVFGYSVLDDERTYWSWNEANGYVSRTYDGSLGSIKQNLEDGTLVASRGLVDNAGQVLHTVPNPIEGRNALVNAASSDGKIVAGRIPVDEEDFHAMRWEVGNDQVEVLGLLDYPNHTDSVARGVSADGKVIVGVSNGPHPELDTRAFVWDQLHGMRELEEVFRDEYGLEVHPWGVGTAEQISDDRRTVVGSIREGRKASGSPGDMWVAVLDWPLGSLRSDFDLDDVLDVDDADLLVAAIQETSRDPLYDLDGDEAIGVGDLETLLSRVERLPGDVDFDGQVDFADFLTLSANFGAAGLWSQGDFDASGEVDFADFLAMSANFGATPSTAAIVPEPSGSACWLFAIVLWYSRRNNSRSEPID